MRHFDGQFIEVAFGFDYLLESVRTEVDLTDTARVEEPNIDEIHPFPPLFVWVWWKGRVLTVFTNHKLVGDDKLLREFCLQVLDISTTASTEEFNLLSVGVTNIHSYSEFVDHRTTRASKTNYHFNLDVRVLN